MELISNLALAGGLSWASGLRLYLTVFVTGMRSKFGHITLPDSLTILSNLIVLSLAGALTVVEFLADKIPYVDSMWDSFQTFARVPAGAMLAMARLMPVIQ